MFSGIPWWGGPELNIPVTLPPLLQKFLSITKNLNFKNIEIKYPFW